MLDQAIAYGSNAVHETEVRAMLGAIFVVSGVRVVLDPDSKVTAAKRVTEALRNPVHSERLTELVELVDARGFAIVYGDTIRAIGQTPAHDDIRALVRWLPRRCPLLQRRFR